jgi:hypothetical protein
LLPAVSTNIGPPCCLLCRGGILLEWLYTGENLCSFNCYLIHASKQLLSCEHHGAAGAAKHATDDALPLLKSALSAQSMLQDSLSLVRYSKSTL